MPKSSSRAEISKRGPLSKITMCQSPITRYSLLKQDYLDMYSINDCMFENISEYVNNQQWDHLDHIQDSHYCSICGIKKKEKVRHCANVRLI